MANFRSQAKEKTAEKASASGQYIVAKDFRFCVNGSMTTFTAGQVIDRPYMITQLLTARLPIRPVGDSSEVAECPHCHKKFLLR